MLELIAEIILIASIIGILFIFFRKMPVLVTLPEVDGTGEKREIRSIERVKFLKAVPEQVFSKMKDFKKAKQEFKKEKNVNLSDDYWEKIRKG